MLDHLWFHEGPVNAAVFAKGDRWVLSASDDRTVIVWDTETGARVGEPLRHSAAVTGLVLSPEGSRFASICADGTARVWDLDSQRPLTRPFPENHSQFHRLSTPAVNFSPTAGTSFRPATKSRWFGLRPPVNPRDCHWLTPVVSITPSSVLTVARCCW